MSTDEHTALFKIFQYYIEVMIPASFAYKNQYAMEGAPIYDDKESQANSANEMVVRRKTVNQLVELHSQGCKIVFANPVDSVRVYEWLKEALDAIQSGLQYTLHTKKLPLEDISKMDSFAQKVQMLARRYSNVDLTLPKFSQNLNRMMNNRGLSRKPGVSSPVTEKPPMPEHVSKLPQITEAILSRGLELKDD